MLTRRRPAGAGPRGDAADRGRPRSPRPMLDAERGFSGNVVQPQTQTALRRAAGVPVLAWRSGRRATQAPTSASAIARLVVDRRPSAGGRSRRRRPIWPSSVPEAPARGERSALAIPHRRSSSTRRARREGGVGSRLNELRAAGNWRWSGDCSSSAPRWPCGSARRRSASDHSPPTGRSTRPASRPSKRRRCEGESWLADRTDLRLFDAQRRGRRPGRRATAGATGCRAFGVSSSRSTSRPAGLFQPAGTWRALIVGVDPDLRPGQRRGVKRAARPIARKRAVRGGGGRAAGQGRRCGSAQLRSSTRRAASSKAREAAAHSPRGAAHHRRRVPRRRHHQHRAGRAQRPPATPRPWSPRPRTRPGQARLEPPRRTRPLPAVAVAGGPSWDSLTP